MTSVLVATVGSGSSSVAVGVTVVATVVVLALLVALVAVVRAARALRQAAEELRESSSQLRQEMGGTLSRAHAELAQAHVELERVDDLVGSAESLAETVGSASRAAYVSLAAPLVKVLAFRRGSARAVQSWRARSRSRRTGRRPSLVGLALRATVSARRR